MPERKADALVKSVKALLTEREVLAAKEKELVSTLNGVLNKMGYQVVALGGRAAATRARGRRGVRGRTPGRKPGRPPKTQARRRRPPKGGRGA